MFGSATTSRGSVSITNSVINAEMSGIGDDRTLAHGPKGFAALNHAAPNLKQDGDL